MLQLHTGASNGKSSGMSRTVQALGTVIGVGVAILATPFAFRYARGPLLTYLTDAWGESIGGPLTLACGGLLGCMFYLTVKLVFISTVTWCAASFASRRL